MKNRATDCESVTISLNKLLKCVLIAFLFFLSSNTQAQITSFPYTEDFESGPAGWFAQGTTSWQWGTPSASLINYPASGFNAWVTNLTGNYSIDEDGWIQSPVFDFSTLSIPEIQFAIWWNCEELFDGVVLQSSVNSGSSWENVGSYGDFNWFTNQFISANPGGQGDGWSGHEENFTGSGGWRIVAHGLPNLIGQSNVIFRLAFASDYSINDEGIGFDLIKIYDGDCNAGDDQNFSACYYNSDVVDLNNYLSFDASTTGTWQSFNEVTIINNSQVDMAAVSSGNYTFRYTVTNGGCVDTSDISISIDKQLDAGNDGELITCSPFTNTDLFNALNGSPDTGGTWTQVSTDPITFRYSHAAVGVCSESSAVVFVYSIQSIDASEGIEEEPCYIFETVNLNDYLPDGIPETGGTWTFRPSTEEPDQDIPISENDDVDFPDTGAGEVAYNFDYDVTEDCVIYSYDLTVNVTIDPFPDAGENKTVDLYCYDYSTLHLNQFVSPNLIPTHNVTWESLDGLTVLNEDEVILPNTGPGQFSYTFDYTIFNSCGQQDTAIITIYLDVLNQTILIPDYEFERYLIDDGIDSNLTPDGEIAISDICDVTALNISNYDIASFEGLQYFSNLTSFYLYNNQSQNLDSIDFSGNILLSNIDVIIAPNLSSIVVNQNVNLETLQVFSQSNAFTSIDVSNNLSLTELLLGNNNLTELNIQNNDFITFLALSSNPLSELNLSNLSALNTLVTFNTNIEYIDLTHNPNLQTWLGDNGNLRLVYLNNGANEILTYLDLRNNLNLNCIYVDNVLNAQDAVDWFKDGFSDYVESQVTIDVQADDNFVQYDGFGNQAQVEAWFNNHGDASVFPDCGNITWTYTYHIIEEPNQNGTDLFYDTIFTATDEFGNSDSTAASFVIEGIKHFSEDFYGLGGTACEDTLDLNTIITDVEPTANIVAFDISYSLSQVNNFQTNQGPFESSFNNTIVDFPDTGAGSFSYLYKATIEKDIPYFRPDQGEFDSIFIYDEALITIDDKTVAFNVEELEDITVCLESGEISSIQDLTDLLVITPDPDVLLPQDPIDLNQYWTPSVYSGSGTYTFNPTSAFPQCPTNAVSITVTEASCSSNLLDLNIFLEGAYDSNTGLMRDDMRTTGVLPTTSPYVDAISCDASVFNVTGSQAIIDWIWLEIRDSNNQTTVIKSRSALLRADGSIVDVDGVSLVNIDIPTDDYYIMLSHRNHLGVLSFNSYTFNGTTISIDFTTSSLLVQGTNNAIANFSDGKYGLYAGDFNGDGQVQNTDRSIVIPLIGLSGYNNADLNLNGEVQNNDINSILTPNIGKGVQFMNRNLFAQRRQN
ncbi:hypothetical protein [Psychroserpens mesophilus]|uniref:leucine-rich repeat domain-containing protein n=1 Tax=Psychroserpens mesophilus TaxID=325473 RepID=UPI003D64CE7D